MSMYKIQMKDGQFSTGGHAPGLSKTGKVWTTHGALSNHFNQLSPRGIKNYLQWGAEIVELAMITVNVWSVQDEIDANAARQAKRKADEKASHEAFIKERELAELKRLQEKYK